MPLHVGDKLGPYELTVKIGEGGMGEVWKARDPRLGRDVAIKFSKEQFTERFEREARAVAALNHPNICQIYDVGPNYIVMEYIDGEAPKGPMPLDEALKIARQMADALEAAHEKGVVHRDLKPANIKIKPDGTVKVLDFGLAQLGLETPVTPDSPTFLASATNAGMILGTAAYMSPEQACGKPVDKRTDIWAFGVVLFEMATGQRLFTAETISETLAAVIKEQPDLTAAPAILQPLLRRCLEKDPKRRLRHIGDAMPILDENERVAVPPSGSRLAKSIPWAVAAALFLAAVGLGALAYRRGAEPQPAVLKLSVLPPDGASYTQAPAVSPDGRHLAFEATVQRKTGLWVRDFDSLTNRQLPGTDAAEVPFWSPDSRTVGFFDGNKLKKVDLAGGPVFTLCDIPAGGGFRGATWAAAGKEVILFALNGAGIFQVPAAGGSPVLVVKPNAAAGELNLIWPWFLPDGHHFLYSAQPLSYRGTVYVADLESGQRKRVLETSFNAMFATGKLLFVADATNGSGNLLAQPFNDRTLQTLGDAVPIAAVAGNGVAEVGFFSASLTGVLAYMSGASESPSQLTWFDRSGKQLGTVGSPSVLRSPAISPDGSTIAVAVSDARAGTADTWLYNVSRGAASRFTFGASVPGFPVWSPDGTRVAFASRGDRVIHGFEKTLNGGKEESFPALGDPPHATLPEDWSHDGRYLVERVVDTPTKDDIWIQPLIPDGKPGPGKAFPYLQTEFEERNASISPDGKWIVYSSDETGRTEVYAQSFATPGQQSPDLDWRRRATPLEPRWQ